MTGDRFARWRLPLRPPWFAAALLATLLATAACGGGGGDGDPPLPSSTTPLADADARPFAMGFSAVPSELTVESHFALFDAAAAFGDAIMIQRAPPWPELAAGAQLSNETLATIERERALLDELGLELLFAIDPFELTDRARLTAGAPGDSFADPAVVDAYLRYVELVIERYRPRWLALAVDVDQIARSNPGGLDAFEAAYRRAYAGAKQQQPHTAVFATFQLEDLQGLLQWVDPHPPQWPLMQRLSDVLDVIAVSTFPSFVFPFVTEIPEEYFSRLRAFEKPLALVPAGYASGPGRDGVTYGTESGQATFLERLLSEADAQQWELVVWLAPRDPSYATATPYDLVAQMGLRDIEGEPKQAWGSWIRDTRRPWQPAAGAAATAELAAPAAPAQADGTSSAEDSEADVRSSSDSEADARSSSEGPAGDPSAEEPPEGAPDA